MSKVNNRRLNNNRNNMNDGGRVLRASFTGEKTAAFERLFFLIFLFGIIYQIPVLTLLGTPLIIYNNHE